MARGGWLGGGEGAAFGGVFLVEEVEAGVVILFRPLRRAKWRCFYVSERCVCRGWDAFSAVPALLTGSAVHAILFSDFSRLKIS